MSRPNLLPKFLTANEASEAILRVAVPLFEGNNILMKRRMCHIVVLVPSMKDERAEDYPSYPNYQIEPHVLYEHSVGENWPHKFDEIARCKALQLWHDRNDDRTDVMPHLLFPGDTPFWGGVKRHGIVVTCSGVEPWFDKMISGMVADMCVALAYHHWMASNDKREGVSFLT